MSEIEGSPFNKKHAADCPTRWKPWAGYCNCKNPLIIIDEAGDVPLHVWNQCNYDPRNHTGKHIHRAI